MSYAIEKLEGRDHYIVPMVMIVEGVLNGSGGPVFYPAAELRRSVTLWDGKPVVIYHPDQHGAPYAGLPHVFNASKVGVIFNTRFESRSLKADAWLDVARLEVLDQRVANAVRRGEVMEVSTGLLIGNDDSGGGIHNGREYHRRAVNLIPDHLAILPDQIGACSIADGAGLCRNRVVVLDEERELVANTEQPLDITKMEW